MAAYMIHNTISGFCVGEFEAETEDGALDAMARDQGYESFAQSCATRDTDETADRAEMDVRLVKAVAVPA